jgi:hypothetical protein
VRRYGKSVNSLFAYKTNFFENNDSYLEKWLKVNRLYSSQPPRTKCKICDRPLGAVVFRQYEVDYTFCNNCGHLNGMNEDTDEFCSTVYASDEGECFATTYNAKSLEEFEKRTQDIYVPKARFLFDALSSLGEATSSISCADIGAGTGYFVSALRKVGLSNSVGHEVSKMQTELGNAMIGENVLFCSDLGESMTIVESLSVDVVSMIGVLEHVQDPRKLLKAYQANPKIRYLFLSVPLFSPSVFIEMSFPNVMTRHLMGTHTHLFTESSLKWMATEFNMKEVASWWFGADIFDLFRSVSVSLAKNGCSDTMNKLWKEMLAPAMDSMQLALDKRHLSSEVHILYKLY